MNYKQFSVEDFVLDEAFRKWVLDPDKASRIFWTRWLDEHPQKAETVAHAIALLRQIPVRQNNLSEQQISTMTEAIEEGINQWEESGRKPEEQKKTIPISAYAATRQQLERKTSEKPWYKMLFTKIAASIVVIFSMLYAIYHEVYSENPQPEIVYEQIVKETPEGQKLTVFLADGSQVILNAGSKISYTKPFEPGRRIIHLDGEAFFQVAKDSLRPFKVISSALTTTALGTSFNISAYPKDDQVLVSLVSGKVKVDYDHDKSRVPEVYYLTPGEQVNYDKAEDTIVKEAFDLLKVLAWKEGMIYLENANQGTVVKTLERWYGIQIVVEGQSTTPWVVTAKFNNQSLKSVLTSLSYTMGFEFEIKEERVLIKYPTNT